MCNVSCRVGGSRERWHAGVVSSPQSAYVPELTDGVVRLRGATPADLPRIVEQANDPEAVRWTTVPHPYAASDAEAFLAVMHEGWLAETGTRTWVIATEELPYAGLVDLRYRGPGVAAVGYVLHPAARGEGLMARALRTAARYAFAVGPWGRPLESITWEAVVGNFASRRVAWACGFTHHGTVTGAVGGRRPDGTEGAMDLWVGSLGAADVMQPVAPWLEVPRLVGERVVLREWRESDRSAAQPMQTLGHFMPDGATPSQLTFDAWLLSRRERAAAGAAVQWCIADKETDEAYGSVHVFSHGHPIDPPGAELGYFLIPAGRGRGLVTEAGQLAIEHAFAPELDGGLGLSRLSAVTAADNEASNAVLRRLGFTRWGTEHRTDELVDGRWEDAYHWELLDGR